MTNMDDLEKLRTKNFIIETIVIFALLAFGCFAICHIVSKSEEISGTEQRNLASLQLQKETESSAYGCFIYGTGVYSSGSEQKMCYYFYEEQPQGGYQLVKMDADDVLICPELEGREQPYEIITKDGYDAIKCRQMYLPKDAIQADYDADISNVEAKNVNAEQELK